MAISTYKVYLMQGTTVSSATTYTKLIDIKDFSDLGGTPEQLDTTTLSDSMHTFIPGIEETSAMEFTANYTASDFNTLKQLEGTEGHYGVFFGSTSGSSGKFTFDGYVSVKVNGGGVNEVVEMTVTITPSSTITFEQGTTSST